MAVAFGCWSAQVNVFLDDMAHFAEMNGVFEKYFAHKPARSCVAVKQLPKGVPVEIECIAYTGTGAKLWCDKNLLMKSRLKWIGQARTGELRRPKRSGKVMI
jgi:hypothetical protein